MFKSSAKLAATGMRIVAVVDVLNNSISSDDIIDSNIISELIGKEPKSDNCWPISFERPDD